ncbi:MAG: aldehyde dehydrogenase family protein, partial [Bacteroidetes bacterium]|nr:aldehyde dehydrogenase family protein [Bacteroidota bacterium]
MINQFEIYAGGSFIQSDNPVTIFNPYDGKTVGIAWLASPQILEEAILKAQSAREAMKNLPSFVKSRILNSIAEEIESKIENFTGILCRESGKPWKYARGEVQRAIQVFRVAAEESKRLPGEFISIDWT